MSSRSATQSAGGSVRSSVKLAGDEAKDKMYEPKHNKKVVRVLTVIAYVFSVSLAAIMLSAYYIFIWQGTTKHPPHQHVTSAECRPAAAGGQNHVRYPVPVFNESQAETPRVLPAQEPHPIHTTPLSQPIPKPQKYTLEEANSTVTELVHS